MAKDSAKSTDRKAAAREINSYMASPDGACLAFALRGAARKISAYYDARLAPAGLTIAQFSVLANTGNLREPSMAELAERLALDPSTLSRNLKPLEESGYLEIHPDPDNRRIRRVRLTEKGKDKLVEAGKLWMAAQKDAVRMIPIGAVAQVQQAVEQLT